MTAPSWRDPEQAAANWRYVAKRARVLFWLLMLPALALIWGAGYAQGLLSHCEAAIRETISKESTK